ncbi:TIGR02757 family protein [Campylobacter upsaliensis]|uniref:TIGR02757 family protein n=1 Tax=Campylobacter upsaliensis TaxID=28080 RepID=UPI00128A2410|nr:TIGR02757 family protein [Campylobacter upsaliensis]EAH7597851.1 TIGR02757 family protein [Campylobacter upsaliensis]EAJ7389927.1 TIGR02757 family protein [Campylobacter upsaliensis]EIE1465678.1 TIGR02757 family protein [Campylobacter upsaliensis]ELS2255047.1 TIGR02757 family protein [Campylobacter upsaliensis]MCR2106782.1 TIGR02757 family protein [Campylobacter upsaliensis]
MLKARLDALASEKNTEEGLKEFADPLQVAKKFNDPYVALMCALFSYGSAKNIMTFLQSLDFTLIDKEEKEIIEGVKELKYRFQTSEDIKQIFITFSRLKKKKNLEELFTSPYKKSGNITDGILNCIKEIDKINTYTSKGYTHFFGKVWEKEPSSPLKRYNLFLRWMVRKDALDLGLWSEISPQDLLIPLDTHTQKMALKLGLLKRQSYDFKAVLELTKSLKEFDIKDPIKYDFALYRLGQGGASGA